MKGASAAASDTQPAAALTRPSLQREGRQGAGGRRGRGRGTVRTHLRQRSASVSQALARAAPCGARRRAPDADADDGESDSARPRHAPDSARTDAATERVSTGRAGARPAPPAPRPSPASKPRWLAASRCESDSASNSA